MHFVECFPIVASDMPMLSYVSYILKHLCIPAAVLEYIHITALQKLLTLEFLVFFLYRLYLSIDELSDGSQTMSAYLSLLSFAN